MSHRVAQILFFLLVVGSILAWPTLPERIPLHYGIDGVPDRWGTRNPLAWFALPLAGGLMLGLFRWARTRARRDPRHLNLPGKERLLRLPEGRRRKVVEGVLELLGWVEAVTLLVFGLLQVGSWVTATGGGGRGLILAAVAICLLGSPIGVALLLLRTQALLDDAEGPPVDGGHDR